MGESAISKQLDAFTKMYMEDKNKQDLKQRELQAQIEELSIRVAAVRSEPVHNKDKGSSSKGNHDNCHGERERMKTLSGDHGIPGWIFHDMTGSLIPWGGSRTVSISFASNTHPITKRWG